MNRRFRILLLALLVIVTGTALGVVGFALHQTMEDPTGEPVAYTATPEPTPTPTATPSPNPVPTPTPTPTPTPYVSPIDFDSLWSVNPHVIAWLEIPDTTVSYPILMHPTEDNHYLNITIEGYTGYPGSIYINALHGQDFQSYNTVIYGHNMLDGSMFGNLKDFRDPEYMKSHREIVIYTPTDEHHYTVCGLVVYDDRYITYTYDDTVEADRQAYLRSLHDGVSGTYWLDDVDVTSDSRLITLSTCIGGMPDNRLLLIAVKQEGEEESLPGETDTIVMPMESPLSADTAA